MRVPGALWYDDSDKSLEKKLFYALGHYEKRGFVFGRVYIHRPSDKQELNALPARCAGLDVIPAPDVLVHHYWFAN